MSGRSSDKSVSRPATAVSQPGVRQQPDRLVLDGGSQPPTQGSAFLDGIGQSIVAAALARSPELLAQARETAFKIESSIEGREVDGTLWTAAAVEAVERGWIRYVELFDEFANSAVQVRANGAEPQQRDLAGALERWRKLDETANALVWVASQISAPGWSLAARIHPDGEIKDHLPGKR